MCVRIIGDSKARLAKIGDLIGEKLPFAPELLGKSCLGDRDTPAVVVAADLRDVNNISALKDISDDLRQIPKRVFLIDQNSRLAIVQAYALGATSVLTSPVTGPKLLRELLKPGTNGERHVKPPSDSGEAAATGAACIASMFTAIVTNVWLGVLRAHQSRRLHASVWFRHSASSRLTIPLLLHLGATIRRRFRSGATNPIQRSNTRCGRSRSRCSLR